MLSYAPITQGDYPTLAKIMKAAFDRDTQMHTDLQEDGPTGYADGSLLRKLNTTGIARKILLDGQIIGAYAIRIADEKMPSEITKAEHILELLFLSPDCTGKGLGKQVWYDIETAFPDATCWTLETPSYSTRNHKFYSSCGFVSCETNPPKTIAKFQKLLSC